MHNYLPQLTRKQRLGRIVHSLPWIRTPITLESVPHLDNHALECYSQLLKNSAGHVEYGAGASTLFAAGFGVPVVSVETDVKFTELLQRRLGNANNVHLRHVDIGRTGDWGVPRKAIPDPATLIKWRRYPIAPWSLAKALGLARPNFVFVDGRFRVASALASLRATAGDDQARIMVDDYTLRPEYWVLEALSEMVGVYGEAAVFKPSRVENARLSTAQSEFECDWR